MAVDLVSTVFSPDDALSCAEVESALGECERAMLPGPASRAWRYPYTDARTELTTDVWPGVHRLLDEYADVQSGDAVLIAYTPDGRSAAAWVASALLHRAIAPIIVPMRPILDDEFEARLAAAVAQAGDRRLVVFTFEMHTLSHGAVLRPLTQTGGTVVRAMGAGTDLFSQALRVGPGSLDDRNSALWSHVGVSEHVRITTSSGTDLSVDMDHDKYRWISNAGRAQTGEFIIVPSGEIATYSPSISGTFVADFAIHTNEPFPFDTRLRACPVTLTIEDSTVVNADVEHDGIRSYLATAFAADNGARIGELGFGTNVGVVEAVDGNSHVNERNCAVHLGIGQHNQSKDAVDYRCSTHIDLIASDGVVVCDGGPSIDLRGRIEHAGPVVAEGLAAEDAHAGHR